MKIAMIFPGYGSQFVGMGKELYDEHRLMQEYFDQASSCLDINFIKLCFASSDAELGRMRNAYTSIFLVSASIVGLLKEMGIKPDIVAGFNQGEYAALFGANGISLPDGLYLLNKFATLYEESQKDVNDVSLISVSGVKAQPLLDICAKASKGDARAYIALFENKEQHIVAGHSQAVERVRDMVSALADEHDINIEHADLALGLHSERMAPVVDQFKIYFNKVDFHDLSVPIIEAVNGNPVQHGSSVHDYMLERITEPVVWPQVMNRLEPYDLVLEIGPGTQLSSWLKKLYPNKKIMAINKPADLEELKALLQLEDKNEQSYHYKK